MALKIIGEEKLRQAQELLKEVFIEDSYGVISPIKFINFETMTPQQSEKRESYEHHRKIATKSYPTVDLYTLKLTIVQETPKPKEEEK